MSQNDIEREENYYERYNKEDSYPRDMEEIRAFRTYARMRQQLNNAKLQDFDQSEIVRLMVEKMAEEPKRFRLFAEPFDLTRSVEALTYAGVFILFLCIGINTLMSIDWNLTQNIQFHSKTSQESSVSLLWKYRLWSGKRVTVPTGIQAEMRLSDGSTLECQGDTQIAIDYSQHRSIVLRSGKVTIHASPNKQRPMIVTTPVGEIQVVGTIFTVELTR